MADTEICNTHYYGKLEYSVVEGLKTLAFRGIKEVYRINISD